ncbi:MAG: argininosuccinate lyase, partial [Gammaproteobacteria bacterium]|nr:argininosuccinate lyase [Gammaproteobacteria bacterium]
MSKDDSRMWGGRFNEPTDEFVQSFTASVSFDRRLALADIEGSNAHATMLKHIGVLNSDELTAIEYGLQQIRDEINDGVFTWSVALEDVHMNIEARL